MTEPYNHDEDDDQPTLQRVAPTSSSSFAAAQVAPAVPSLIAFLDEAPTTNDLDVLGHDTVALVGSPIGDARDFDDIDTEKMPIDVRAGLLRASQVDDGV